MSAEVKQCPECPNEGNFEAPVISAVADDEALVRFVASNDDLLFENGAWRLNPGTFAGNDIKGILDASGRRSVSTYRFDSMPRQDLLARAAEKTANPLWTNNPVGALGKAGAIRHTLENKRREFCVYADCSEATPASPSSPWHGSIRRSEPASRGAQRLDMMMMKSALSDAFGRVVFLRTETDLPP